MKKSSLLSVLKIALLSGRIRQANGSNFMAGKRLERNKLLKGDYGHYYHKVGEFMRAKVLISITAGVW